MSENPKPWYYAVAGQRFGPMSAAELKSAAEQGRLQAGDLVWKEGMTQWTQARNIPGLVPENNEMPYWGVTEEIRPEVKVPAGIRPISFALLIVLLIAFTGFFIFAGSLYEKPPTDIPPDIWLRLKTMTPTQKLPATLGTMCILIYTVLSYVCLFRAWKLIVANDYGNGITPGRAVAFNFIPIFNLYWSFRCFYGWADEYDKMRIKLAPDAPDLHPRLFLIYPVALIVMIFFDAFSIAAMIGQLLALWHMNRVLAYFARQRDDKL